MRSLLLSSPVFILGGTRARAWTSCPPSASRRWLASLRTSNDDAPLSMLPPFPPQLVTLDATGTLMETRAEVGELYRQAWVEGGGPDHQARLSPSVLTAAFLKAYACRSRSYPNFGSRDNGSMSEEEWWRGVVEEVFATSLNIPPEEVQALLDSGRIFHKLFHDIFASKGGWKPIEGAYDLLNALRSLPNRPKLHVVSNFDSRCPRLLRELEIADYVDGITWSSRVKVEKPNPKIWDEAKDQMRLVRGSRSVPRSDDSDDRVDDIVAWHIGDNWERDVEGALRAGMHPIWLNTKVKKRYLPLSQQRVSEYSSAAELARAIRSRSAQQHVSHENPSG